MDIKDTKTAENLRKALAGESIARNKYTYFAQAARASGDEEAAAAFEQMAKNEMMHAKFWFELLYGKPGDTRECLTQAAMGEYSEWHDMYPDFAAQAREEGLEEIAVPNLYYLEYQSRKLRLVMKHGERMIRGKVSEFSERLASYGFASPHKSFIVNLYHVKAIRGYDIVMMNGDLVPLSQKRSAEFRGLLGKYQADRLGSVWK